MEFPLVIRAQLPPSNVSQETNFQSRIIKKKKERNGALRCERITHTHTSRDLISRVLTDRQAVRHPMSPTIQNVVLTEVTAENKSFYYCRETFFYDLGL